MLWVWLSCLFSCLFFRIVSWPFLDLHGIDILKSLGQLFCRRSPSSGLSDYFLTMCFLGPCSQQMAQLRLTSCLVHFPFKSAGRPRDHRTLWPQPQKSCPGDTASLWNNSSSEMVITREDTAFPVKPGYLLGCHLVPPGLSDNFKKNKKSSYFITSFCLHLKVTICPVLIEQTGKTLGKLDQMWLKCHETISVLLWCFSKL